MGSYRDSRDWSVEVGGRLIEVVVKGGFTVPINQANLIGNEET